MGKDMFVNKVIIVTGAASGIGLATARQFAREGAHVVMNDLYENMLTAVLKEIGNETRHEIVAGDVSQESTSISLVNVALQRFGNIDVLVNNAGVHCIKDIDKVSSEDFDRIIGVNLKSMFLCSKHVLPVMLRQRKGAIINLASISSYVGQEMMGKSTFLYNITKAGALQLTKSLATRYAADGIRVNCVVPGATHTNQITTKDTEDLEMFWRLAGESHPMKRTGTPDEIANCILFLASDAASFVTGSPLIVDGGYLAQ